MPSPEEVLATKLWTLAKYAKEFKALVEIYDSNNVRYEIKDVIDLSDELHPKVVIIVEQYVSPAVQAVQVAVEKIGDVEAITEFLSRVASGAITEEMLENAVKDSTVEKEPGQGDVPSGGHPGQPSTDSPSVRPTTTHSGGPEEM